MSVFQTQSHATLQQLCNQIQMLSRDDTSRNLAKERGLDIVEVAWEDTARNKFSSYGPNISDLTLLVLGVRMPLFRPPNYTDFTWDVAMDQIPLVVGNENGSLRKSVSLSKYLQNISQYTGLKSSLYCPGRDSHALVSAQSCFLPVPPKEEPLLFFGASPTIQDPTKFNINIFNHQSTENDPLVLAIVATNEGTSAQILGKRGGSGFFAGQKLYFNNNGSRHAFKAQRLTYDRIQRGETDLTKSMTDEEKQNNAIVVIQVPLKRKSKPATFGFSPIPSDFANNRSIAYRTQNPPTLYMPTYKPSANNTPYSFGGNIPPQRSSSPAVLFGATPSSKLHIQTPPPAPSSNQNLWHTPMFGSQPTHTHVSSIASNIENIPVDVENAIISLAPSDGQFPSLKGKDLERDDRYPVRVTIQWYKVTSTGKVDDVVVDEIHSQMQLAKSKGDFWGSLVVDQNSWNSQNNRLTAPIPSVTKLIGRHPGINCDGCNQTFVDNTMRYRCIYCPDFDLCWLCHDQKSHGHNAKHMFAAVEDSTLAAISVNVRMASKTELNHNLSCTQCQQNIVGARYVCAVCRSDTPGRTLINLCDSCADNSGHANNRHPLIRVWYSEDLKQIGLV